MICCKHRPEFEISKIETISAKLSLPKSKHFLICTAYRPPNATASWIGVLKEEPSATQTSGFEILLMSYINIDFQVVQITNGFTLFSYLVLHRWSLIILGKP